MKTFVTDGNKQACQINSSILKVKHSENSENGNAVRLLEI